MLQLVGYVKVHNKIYQLSRDPHLCFESNNRKTCRSSCVVQPAGSTALSVFTATQQRTGTVWGHLTASKECYDISQVKWGLFVCLFFNAVSNGAVKFNSLCTLPERSDVGRSRLNLRLPARKKQGGFHPTPQSPGYIDHCNSGTSALVSYFDISFKETPTRFFLLLSCALVKVWLWNKKWGDVGSTDKNVNFNLGWISLAASKFTSTCSKFFTCIALCTRSLCVYAWRDSFSEALVFIWNNHNFSPTTWQNFLCSLS